MTCLLLDALMVACISTMILILPYNDVVLKQFHCFDSRWWGCHGRSLPLFSLCLLCALIALSQRSPSDRLIIDLTLMPRMILMKASHSDFILTQLHCFCFCSRVCVCFGRLLSRVSEFVLSDILGLIDFLFSPCADTV